MRNVKYIFFFLNLVTISDNLFNIIFFKCSEFRELIQSFMYLGFLII